MSIKDRIENIKEYFKGMEMRGDTFIVNVVYKDKWGAYPNEEGTIKVAKSEDTANSYFYYANYNNINIEEIFDLIEATIKDNIDAAVKIQLLNEKFSLLKEIFASHTLDELQNLVIELPPIKSKKRTKRKPKKEEPIVQEETLIGENITKEEEFES